MDKAEKSKIKKDIIQGVYEEKLKIVLPYSPPVSSTGTSSAKGVRFFAPALLFLILTAFYFVPGFMDNQPAEPLQSFSDQSPTLPWDRIMLKSQQVGGVGVLQSPPQQSSKPSWPEQSFDAKNLLQYNLLLDQEQVRLSSVFGLSVQTLVIDPGHGGKDPGAIGGEGTREKDVVLDIALNLQKMLQKNGRYNVLLTRETDRYVSLAERVRFSNEHHADLFISLHVNALPQKDYNVTETFYFGPPKDDYTLRLAQKENRGSEILNGDFNEMIKKIGEVLKEQESARLASIIQYSLFTNMEKYDRILADNGTKIAPFVVLLGVDAPSVLVEISCISKSEEEINLKNPEYRKKISRSLVEGINGYLAQRETQVVKGEENDGKKIKNNKS